MYLNLFSSSYFDVESTFSPFNCESSCSRVDFGSSTLDCTARGQQRSEAWFRSKKVLREKKKGKIKPNRTQTDAMSFWFWLSLNVPCPVQTFVSAVWRFTLLLTRTNLILQPVWSVQSMKLCSTSVSPGGSCLTKHQKFYCNFLHKESGNWIKWKEWDLSERDLNAVFNTESLACLV